LSEELNDKEPSQEGRYVYCIIETKEPQNFGSIGIGGRGDDVYTVHYEELAAVVSNTPFKTYEPIREHIFAHENVNELVMDKFTVLPMAFGALFSNDQDIIDLMRATYDALRDVLYKMRGKVEFGLKVNWDRNAMIAEIEEENEEIREIKEEISSNPQTTTYFAKVELGHLIEDALTERADKYINEIYSSLRSSIVASKASKPIGDKMIMNAAFLVERSEEESFDNKLKEIASMYEGRLSFRYTGPCPPYNFVHVRLKLDRPDNIVQ
jgi:hypothetical protein